MTNTHFNLTNKKGSIAHALLEIKSEVDSMVSTPSVTLVGLKLFISTKVNNITNKETKSPATCRFLDSLEKQYSKQGVLSLVWNTILAGDNLKTC